jgi:hypothetical protein
MLVFLKLASNFSRGCALRDQARISSDPPHRLTIGRSTLAMPLAARVNEAGDVLPAPLDQVMRLRQKLIDVVVVAVV